MTVASILCSRHYSPIERSGGRDLQVSERPDAARVERTDKALRLSTDVPAFRQFLESRLSELLKEFEALGLKKPDHSKEGGAGRGD